MTMFNNLDVDVDIEIGVDIEIEIDSESKEKIMMKMNGKMYVKGTVNITPAALSRLAEMGVTPPKNRYPQGGEFDSFYLPEGEDGAEFHHRGGSPASAGKLSLASE